MLKLVAEANPANISAKQTRGSVAHFEVQEKKSDNLRYIYSMAPEQLLVVNGNDRTPLSYAVEEDFDNPEFFEAVALLAPEAAIIVNQEEDNLLYMMATHLSGQSTGTLPPVQPLTKD